MTKKELASLQRYCLNAEQISKDTNERLVAIIQDSLSALANSDPELALQVVEQVSEQKTMLQGAIEDRKTSDEGFIEMLASKLPDSLELEN